MLFLFSLLACNSGSKDSSTFQNNIDFLDALSGEDLPDGLWFMGTGFFPQNMYTGIGGLVLRENQETRCTVIWEIAEVYPIADCSVCEYGAFTLVRGEIVNQQGTGCHDVEPEQYVGTSESIGVSDGVPYVLLQNAWEPKYSGMGLLRADISLLHYVYSAE